MAMGFGIIHDLADIETKVRGKLQSAAHEIRCGIAALDEIGQNEDPTGLTEAMQFIERALKAIAEVIGD